MSKQQPTIEELLKTREGTKVLSEVWRKKSDKATDPEEKKLRTTLGRPTSVFPIKRLRSERRSSLPQLARLVQVS